MKKITIFLSFALITCAASAQLNWNQVINYNSFVNPADMAQAPDGSIYLLWQHPQFVAGLDKSSDGGNNWTDITSPNFPNTVPAFDIAFSGNKLLLISDSLRISPDNGQTWPQTGNGLSQSLDLGRMTVLPDGTVFLAASTNTDTPAVLKLYKSTDNGSSWSNVSITGIPASLVPVDITSIQSYLIMSLKNMATNAGAFYRSSDGGSSWTALSFPAVTSQFYSDNSFACDAFGDIYVIGRELFPSGIRLFWSPNNGSSWGEITSTGLNTLAGPQTFIKTSTALIVAGYTNTQGQSAMYKTTVSVGINKTTITGSIDVYPNPCSTELFIQTGTVNNLEHLAIIDISGRLVYEKTAPVIGAVDVSRIKAGIYIVKITDDANAVYYKRVVIGK